jgi:hypothetical protein
MYGKQIITTSNLYDIIRYVLNNKIEHHNISKLISYLDNSNIM